MEINSNWLLSTHISNIYSHNILCFFIDFCICNYIAFLFFLLIFLFSFFFFFNLRFYYFSFIFGCKTCESSFNWYWKSIFHFQYIRRVIEIILSNDNICNIWLYINLIINRFEGDWNILSNILLNNVKYKYRSLLLIINFLLLSSLRL